MSFVLPIGDSELLRCSASMRVTRSLSLSLGMASVAPVPGQLILTTRQLVFLPLDPALAQRFTMPLWDGLDPHALEQRRWWVLTAPPVLSVRPQHLGEAVLFDVDETETVVDTIRGQLATPVPQMSPQDRLGLALASTSNNRQAWSEAILGLSFPGGFWHAGSADNIADILSDDVERLQLPLSAEQQANIVGAATSPVDDADADEDGLRAQEILDLVREITSTIGPSQRTFHRFVSDFPGWDEEDPLHLWLTQEQATALTQRGIVTPLGTT